MSGVRQLVRDARKQVQRLRRKWFHSISDAELERALSKVLVANPEILMVHSSLSKCGFLVPGPEGVIAALQRQCETLCMPTHTYCYPINGIAETYDPRQTASLVGAITNTFRNQEGVERSVHPTHSLAASGPRAVELCENHQHRETACGEGTPYLRLIEADASVLMFGATMNSYTLFHCAEDTAKCGYLYEPEPYKLRATGYDGVVHEVSLRRQDMAVPRRFTEMRDELKEQGLLEITPLGMSELLFIPSTKNVHEYTTDRLNENEYHLVEGKAKPASS